MTQFYSKDIATVISDLTTDEKTGLSSAEIVARLEEYGHNKIESKKKKSFLIMFLSQFKSFMIIILLIAALISGVVGIMEGEGLFDTFIILGILFLNALIGAFQEKKAESSLEALMSLAAPETKALRDGKVKPVPSFLQISGLLKP
jgi:Ca2+-transporting ATPase